MQRLDRRFREGLTWVTDKPPRKPILPRVIAVLLIVVVVQGLLLYFSSEQYTRLREELEKGKIAMELSRDSYSGMLAHCLNGGTLMDKNSGHFLFTDKATVIKLK